MTQSNNKSPGKNSQIYYRAKMNRMFELEKLSKLGFDETALIKYPLIELFFN